MKEEYFVTTYVRKAKQERLLYELSHKEKRYRALDRFCHSADALLNKEKVVLKGNNLLYSDSFNRFIQGQHEPCLVLSPDPSVDGQTLPPKKPSRQPLAHWMPVSSSIPALPMCRRKPWLPPAHRQSGN